MADEETYQRSIRQMKEMASFYDRQALKLNTTLQAAGIGPAQLPASVKKRLSDLVKCAELVGCEGDFTLDDIRTKFSEVLATKEELQLKVESLEPVAQELGDMLDCAKEAAKNQGPAPMSQKDDLDSVIKSLQKADDADKANLRAVEMQLVEVPEHFEPLQLVDDLKKLRRLKQEKKELKEKLERMHGLPPDKDLMRRKVALEKETLEALKAEMNALVKKECKVVTQSLSTK
ncbi:uncharacterized protein LOC120841874 [Ixodes scapularis]|uniref:uncharacterized protein LOC120841874 n=1 Tax=Ixodes scapularis TaxID=6945 RepID=UPI001A9D3EFB|nr:uncharacterized protein LOC120841874 [Ixodes scapularis]XP_040068804.1 uncharacterized protein LOC120841874 [Ixodes scapularis]